MLVKISNKTESRILVSSFLAMVMLVAGGCGQGSSRKVDFNSELNVLTNISGLAEVPYGVAGMLTSYDRTGGNSDGTTFTGATKDGNPLIADLKGPGCVKRFWLTGMPPETKFYFYFDDETSPRFIWTHSDIANGKAGTVLVKPVCNYPSGAIYTYSPIPYAKRLIISTDKVKQGQFFFFHVNYTTYKSGTTVESLGASPSASQAAGILAVAEQWMKGGQGASATMTQFADLQGMSTFTIKESGPAIIRELGFKPEFKEDMPVTERNAMLRALSLRIYWDGSLAPAIDVPFGDFFCNAVRVRQFDSMPFSVKDGEFICRFPMPFRKSAKVEIVNPTDKSFRMGYRLTKSDEPVSDLNRYFHATWRQSMSPGVPHEIFNIGGKGHYVGCYLIHVGMEGSWNIYEGDECFYKNGEALPYMHGTGLEDYFNGGWYHNFGVFTTPFAGCLEKSAIKATQYRFHVPDPVEYDNGLKLNIEFGHGNTSRGYMSSVAYWYSDKPDGVPYSLPTADKRFMPQDPIERTAFMNEIFERERVCNVDELKDLCAEYAQKYPGTAEAQMYMLRRLMYMAKEHGFSAVDGEISRLVSGAADPEMARQAEALKRFHSSKTNALVVAHINAAYKVWLDGVELFGGDDPNIVNFACAALVPGEHTLCIETKVTRMDPWVSVAIVIPDRIFLSNDNTWKCSKTASDGWTRPGYNDSGWITAQPGGPFPWMRYFQFKPNAFIFTQYDKQLLGSPEGFSMGETAHFRKTFEFETR